MDITRVSSSSITSEFFEDSESEMSLRGTQIQGDYSGYVPPDVFVSSDSAVAPLRKTSSSRPPSRGGLRPVSPTEIPVQVRGNLQKMGKRLKGWHSRYFEIQGEHMYYYKTHMKKECMGEIQLRNCYFCDATNAATFGHAFELRTTDRSHILAARTNDEMVQWVRVIRKNMGTSEQEAAARKAAKPKRWESFKQALAIQPRRTSVPDKTEPKKKQNRKSFGNKLKIRKDSKDKSPSHISQASLSNSHPTPSDENRPMSLTEDDVGQDTLDILAALQPPRSLPATPFAIKRPMNFEDPPDSPNFLRASAGSPALTLDSTLSTPGTSAHASPAHMPQGEVEVAMDESITAVETTEKALRDENSAEDLVEEDIKGNGAVVPEDTVHEESSEKDAQGEVSKSEDNEVLVPPVVETQTVELVQQVEATSGLPSELEAVQNGGSLTQNGLSELEAVEPVQNNETLTENGLPESEVENKENVTENGHSESQQISSEASLPSNVEAAQIEAEPVPSTPHENVPKIVEPISEQKEPLVDIPPEELNKKYTWDEIRELVEPADNEEEKDYSMLPPLPTPWLSHDTAIEQLRAFLLACP